MPGAWRDAQLAGKAARAIGRYGYYDPGRHADSSDTWFSQASESKKVFVAPSDSARFNALQAEARRINDRLEHGTATNGEVTAYNSSVLAFARARPAPSYPAHTRTQGGSVRGLVTLQPLPRHSSCIYYKVRVTSANKHEHQAVQHLLSTLRSKSKAGTLTSAEVRSFNDRVKRLAAAGADQVLVPGGSSRQLAINDVPIFSEYCATTIIDRHGFTRNGMEYDFTSLHQGF